MDKSFIYYSLHNKCNTLVKLSHTNYDKTIFCEICREYFSADYKFYKIELDGNINKLNIQSHPYIQLSKLTCKELLLLNISKVEYSELNCILFWQQYQQYHSIGMNYKQFISIGYKKESLFKKILNVLKQ